MSGVRDWVSAKVFLGTAHVLGEAEFNELGPPDSLPKNVLYATHRIKPRVPGTLNFDWNDRVDLAAGEFPSRRCEVCHKKMRDGLKAEEEYKRNRPLRAFDPFGGAGAFALGMASTGHMRLTHAIELDMDTATTLKYAPQIHAVTPVAKVLLCAVCRRNSPDTVVYNACANRVFDYSVRCFRNYQDKGAPIKLVDEDSSTPVPPVLPKFIDILIAGFPWSALPSSTAEHR